MQSAAGDARGLMAETPAVAAEPGWNPRQKINVDELSQRKDHKPEVRLSMPQDVLPA